MKQSYLIAAGCNSDRQNYRVRKASRRALVHCNLPGIRACHVVPAAQLQRYGHQHGVAPEGRQGDREPESGELHEGRQQALDSQKAPDNPGTTPLRDRNLDWHREV
jgi:hypothetical protein